VREQAAEVLFPQPASLLHPHLTRGISTEPGEGNKGHYATMPLKNCGNPETAQRLKTERGLAHI